MGQLTGSVVIAKGIKLSALSVKSSARLLIKLMASQSRSKNLRTMTRSRFKNAVKALVSNTITRLVSRLSSIKCKLRIVR